MMDRVATLKARMINLSLYMSGKYSMFRVITVNLLFTVTQINNENQLFNIFPGN